VKTIPIALQTTLDSSAPTLAAALKITRRDNAVFAFTTLDESQTIDGVLYVAHGLDDSAFDAAPDLSVGNLTLTTRDNGSIWTTKDVRGGLWQAARFECFRYDWTDPTKGKEYLASGELGQITLKDGGVEIELRDWRQYLQQPVGVTVSKTCRSRLGDSGCKVSLAPYTHTATVTAVASRSVFTSSGLATARPNEDFFGEGEILFNDGPCAGMRQKVRSYTAAGVVTLVLAMPEDFDVGDSITAIAGCRRRHERTTDNPGGVSDCVDKFNNILNFQGEPHLPGIDSLTQEPEPGGG